MILLFVFYLNMFACDSCEIFKDNNPDFSSKLWIEDLHTFRGYRLDWVNTLKIKGLKKNCVIENLGEPNSSTPTSIVYIIREENKERYMVGRMEYSILFEDGVVHSTNISLE